MLRLIRFLLVAGIAVGVALCVWLTMRGGPTPELGTLGALGALRMTPEQSIAKKKLGTATRDAIRVSPDSAFDVIVNKPVGALIFSVGVHAAETLPGMGVRFVVSRENQDGWEELFSDTVPSQQRGWQDCVVAFDEFTALRRLRLHTLCVGGESCRGVSPYWGSVSVTTERVRLLRSKAMPNVILISIDTLGAEQVSSLGGKPGVTPHIDRILGRSFSFRRAYTTYPNTPNGHASLFTGLYPKNHRHYELHTLRAQTLAEVFRRNRYLTAAITEDAYVSSDFGFDRGFAQYENGSPEVSTEFLGDSKGTFRAGLDWIEKFGRHGPFFLFLHTYEVHTPYIPKDDKALQIVRRIDPGYVGFYPNSYNYPLRELLHNCGKHRIGARGRRHIEALHEGEVNYLDRQLARFMEELASLPVSPDTLVVTTADHGEELGAHGMMGHGETLFNEVLHVPLAFYWSGMITAGASERVVDLVDVMPTILELVGLPVRRGVDGEWLVLIIRGQWEAGKPSLAFAEVRVAYADCGPRCEDQRRVERFAVQDARFKLITSVARPSESSHDLKADRDETSEVSRDFPGELEGYRRLVREYVNNTAEPGANIPTVAPSLGRETGQGLRALGYRRRRQRLFGRE